MRRHPDVRWSRQTLEPSGHNTDDCVALQIQANSLADRSRVGAVPPLPEAMTDHGDHVLLRSDVFLSQKTPAGRRLDAVDLWHGDTFKSGVDGDLVSCRLMGRFSALAQREDAQGIVVAFPLDIAKVGARDAATIRSRVTQVLDCARQAGLATLDADQGFAAAGAERDPQRFYFDRHFTDRGNALAARLIASVLEGADTDRRSKGERRATLQ